MVLTKAKVTQICVKDREVYGVVLENGQLVRAKKIISTIGLWNTNEAMPGKYKTTIDLPYNDNFSTLNVFIGVELGEKNIFPTHNIWYHPISKATNYDLYENSQCMLEASDLSR